MDKAGEIINMKRKNLIGIMVNNNKVIMLDRSKLLADARKMIDGFRKDKDSDKAEQIVMAYAWRNMTAVSHIQWTLQERLFFNKRNIWS